MPVPRTHLSFVADAIARQQRPNTVLVPADALAAGSSLLSSNLVVAWGTEALPAALLPAGAQVTAVPADFCATVQSMHTREHALPADLAITGPDLQFDEFLRCLSAWDPHARANAILLLPYASAFDSIAAFALAQLADFKTRILTLDGHSHVALCKQKSGPALGPRFLEDSRSATARAPDRPEFFIRDIDRAYAELKNENRISVAMTGLGSIKRHCADSGSSFRTLRPAGAVTVELPLPAISADEVQVERKRVEFGTPEVFVAELRDVLMYGNFVVCTEERHMTLAGVRYTNVKYFQMPDAEQRRYGFGYQSFDIGTPMRVREPAVLLGAAQHYGHFFVECADRLWAMNQCPELRECTYVTDGPLKSPYRDILERLGHAPPPGRILCADPARWLRFDRLHLPALSTQKPIIPAHVVDFLGTEIRPGKLLGAPRGIYLSRSKVATRRLLNEAELVEALRSRGIEPVFLEDMSFDQQITLLAHVDVVIGVIGSAFFNLLWAKPGAKAALILNGEDPGLRDTDAGHPDAVMYHSICQRKGLDMRVIRATPQPAAHSKTDYGSSYNRHLSLEPAAMAGLLAWIDGRA